jgi:lysozyme
MWFELDLGQVRAIEGVRLEVPEAVNHNPRGYEIQVSENKDYWLTVAEDKNNDSLVGVEFETQLARYVRVTLTQDADRWWSIHEIKVDFYEPPPPPEALDVSEAGLRFIAAHEGLRLQMYNDAANHCTIGVGHLIHLGPCDGRASEGPFLQGISQVQAEELLKQDAQAKVEAVRSLVTVALNQAQFDALVSFVFNVGRGNFARSDLLAQLNQGNYEAVPSELKRWNKAGGKVLPGLVRRREEEAKLFTAGVYGAG